MRFTSKKKKKNGTQIFYYKKTHNSSSQPSSFAKRKIIFFCISNKQWRTKQMDPYIEQRLAIYETTAWNTNQIK